jgi:hypothetical protein
VRRLASHTCYSRTIEAAWGLAEGPVFPPRLRVDQIRVDAVAIPLVRELTGVLSEDRVREDRLGAPLEHRTRQQVTE